MNKWWKYLGLAVVGLGLAYGGYAVGQNDQRNSVTDDPSWREATDHAATYLEADIASGAQVSQAMYLQDGIVVGIQTPETTWDGGNITFNCSADGVTFESLVDTAGTAWTLTSPAADRSYDLTLTGEAIGGCMWIQLTTGSAPSADRIVRLTVGR